MDVYRRHLSHRRRILDTSYARKVLDLDPIAYWPLWELSGSVATDISGNGRNGAYTGVTLGQTGIGDGRTAPLFDGTNDYCNVHSAGLASAFNGAEGTLAVWVKVSGAGVWTDSAWHYIANIYVDSNNYLRIAKHSTNNRLAWYYMAGSTSEYKFREGTTSTDWMHLAMTWNKTVDTVTYYYGGSSIGTSTGLGAWDGSPAVAIIGAANTTPDFVWGGYIAHPLVLATALTAAQIGSLATV